VEILIIHPGGLGDVVLSLPAVAHLRNRYPASRITAAGNIDHLVPVMSGYAENTISISALPLHHLYISDPPPDAVVSFWRSFDLIVSWTGGGNEEFVGRFQKIHPNVLIASWKPAPEEKRHVSQIFVDSLSAAGDTNVPSAFTPILLNSELLREGMQWLVTRGWDGRVPLTALHAGAGSESKRWPVSRFGRLAEHIAVSEKRKLLLVEGAAERGLSRQIVAGLPAGSAFEFNSMSLSLLAAVTAHCDLFVGNDSGVAHLAAALNVRSVVLFGPTLPQHWAPLGRDVTILRNTLGCEGCGSAGSRHSCLENITVEEVIRHSNFNLI
jgi:ADP-heptose:LPS heptosyltransferase